MKGKVLYNNSIRKVVESSCISSMVNVQVKLMAGCTSNDERNSRINLQFLWLRCACYGGSTLLGRAKGTKTRQDPQRLILLYLLHWPSPHLADNQCHRTPRALRVMGSATFQDVELPLDVRSTDLVYPESNLVLCRISDKLLEGFAVIARLAASDCHVFRPAFWWSSTTTRACWLTQTLDHGNEASDDGNESIAFEIA